MDILPSALDRLQTCISMEHDIVLDFVLVFSEMMGGVGMFQRLQGCSEFRPFSVMVGKTRCVVVYHEFILVMI